jgi:hypothetical protein
MNPSMSQALAEEHRRDLARTAARHQRPSRRGGDTPVHASWDTKLGWLLIRVGCRLVAQRVTPAEAAPLSSA